MFDQIKAKLKNNGYVPGTVIDIGARYGKFADRMIDIYPNSNYYLFEKNNIPELEKYLVRDNVKVFKVLLGSENTNISQYLTDILNMKNVLIKIDSKKSKINILKHVGDILKITDYVIFSNLDLSECELIEYMISNGFIISGNLDETTFMFQNKNL